LSTPICLASLSTSTRALCDGTTICTKTSAQPSNATVTIFETSAFRTKTKVIETLCRQGVDRMKTLRMEDLKSLFHKATRCARALVAACMLCVISSCSSCSTNTYTRAQDVIFPDSNVSYSHSVQPLMALGCAFAGCHGPNNAEPLDSYVSILSGSAGMIIPFKPDQSKLVQVIQGKLNHTYSLGNTITENHKKGIARWVLEGAKNN